MHQQAISRIKNEWQEEIARVRRKERPKDFPNLPEIPVGRYTAREFYNLERDYLWPKVWLLAGHVDELPEPGSFKTWDASGMPVILIRGKDNLIRAFFNVCRHRGAALTTEPCGRRNALSCIYHSWTYDLEGRLVFVPDEYEFGMIDKEAKGLKPLKCALWGSLIFVNADVDCQELQDFVGPIMTELEDMRFDSLTLFAKLSYDLNCNWKCVQDAFEEGYHIATVHKSTVAKFLDFEVGTRRLFRNGHGLQIVKKQTGDEFETANVFDRYTEADDPAHEITRNSSRAHSIFPNLTVPVAVSQFPVIVPWPTGPDSCRVEVYYLAAPGHGDPDSETCKQVVQMFDVVTKEDLGVLNSLQLGMQSGAITSIPLSYSERLIYNHHENLDRVIGMERIPESLRVPQIMSEFWEA